MAIGCIGRTWQLQSLEVINSVVRSTATMFHRLALCLVTFLTVARLVSAGALRQPTIISGKGDAKAEAPAFENQNSACDDTLVLTGRSGQIISYNYPNRYTKDLNCSWQISADIQNEEKLNVVFYSFYTYYQSSKPCDAVDYITFHDGPDAGTSSPEIETFCGNKVPKPFYASGSDLFVRFISQSRFQRDGFAIFWNVENELEVEDQNSACTDSPLSLTGSSGQLVSWNYPDKYAKNLNCAWTITAAPIADDKSVYLYFQYTDMRSTTKCTLDFLTIHDGASANSPVVGRFCGRNIPASRMVEGTGNQFYVTFNTQTSTPLNGFRLLWGTQDKVAVNHDHTTTACLRNGSQIQTGVEGEIFSWRYPQNYANGLHCSWEIVGSNEDEVIQLIFQTFDVESSTSCVSDNLTVYEMAVGADISGREVAQFCGNKVPWNLVIDTNRMRLIFKTDHTVTKKGFHIKWRSANPDDFQLPTYNGTCGIPEIPIRPGNGKVVGGQASTPGSWPWQADMQLGTRHYCGGSLIHPQWVLSAAHCFTRNPQPSKWSAVLGKYNKNKVDETEQRMKIEKLFYHQKHGRNDWDVALLKLKEPVEINSRVSPVCMPEKNFVVANGTMCYTTGWGNTHGTGNDNVLKQAAVPVVDRASCNRREAYSGRVTERMVCAGYYIAGGHDACQGDSGGPFVCYKNEDDGNGNLDNPFEVIGITSWGTGCARPNKPGVYSRTAAFIDWIENVMKMNN